MATITKVQARYWKNAFGLAAITRGGPEETGVKETASQTYAKGAPVYYDTNGTIAITVASSNVIAQHAGFAHKAATGTTAEQVTYRATLPGDIYIVNVAGTSTTTTNLNQVGDITNFDMSSGLMVTNPDGTDDTKLAALIVGLFTSAWGFTDGDTAGDTNGRQLVRFIDNKALQG